MRLIQAVLVTLMVTFAPQVQAQATMQLMQLIQALQLADFSDVSEKLYNANTVYVTRITELAGIRLQGDRLTNMVDRRTRHLRSLRAMVRNSKAAIKALERHGEQLDNVIFATATNDGAAMLYVDNR